MNGFLRILTGVLSVTVLLTAGSMAASETADKEARVTRIIKDVKILPSESDARPAVVDEKVQEGTAVRTGDESRSELTFVDLTITRLGANTVYSFDKAGRNIRLQSGTILVRVPKDSGGAQMITSAVTVAITGTTGIFALTPEGQNSLIILEGGARMSLNKYPGKSARVRAGKRIDVEADAKKLPPPKDVDLEQLMQTSPLITDFPPLPSQDLILEAIRKQNPRSHVTSLPTGGGPTQPGPVVYPSQPVNTGGPPPPLPSFCWCCVNGEVRQTTYEECRRIGAQCYGSREEALRNCKKHDQGWWCCIDGHVVQSTEAECRARGGQLYRSEEEARRQCGDRRQCWCCAHGEVFRTTELECQRGGGQCYGSEQEAGQHCKPKTTTTYWSCIDGQVRQTTEAECRASGAPCYGSREEAIRHCKEAKKNCWCCVEGQVVQTTEAECRSREGQCYGSRKEATRHCRGERPTPTPTPHRHTNPKEPGDGGYGHGPTPTPTPHRQHWPKGSNPNGPGYGGGSGQLVNPHGPRGTPTPTPPPRKKRLPRQPGQTY